MQKDSKQGSKQKDEQQGNQQRSADQGGTTGHAGMGGDDTTYRGEAQQVQQNEGSSSPSDDLIGMDEPAEVQQSAQREGMGHHRRSSRGNEQAIDAASDIDDLGNHVSSAGKSRP